jgi:hypothetical protein
VDSLNDPDLTLAMLDFPQVVKSLW